MTLVFTHSSRKRRETHVHSEEACDQRTKTNAHSRNGDLQIKGKKCITIRVQYELNDFLSSLYIALLTESVSPNKSITS